MRKRGISRWDVIRTCMLGVGGGPIAGRRERVQMIQDSVSTSCAPAEQPEVRAPTKPLTSAFVSEELCTGSPSVLCGPRLRARVWRRQDDSVLEGTTSEEVQRQSSGDRRNPPARGRRVRRPKRRPHLRGGADCQIWSRTARSMQSPRPGHEGSTPLNASKDSTEDETFTGSSGRFSEAGPTRVQRQHPWIPSLWDDEYRVSAGLTCESKASVGCCTAAVACRQAFIEQIGIAIEERAGCSVWLAIGPQLVRATGGRHARTTSCPRRPHNLGLDHREQPHFGSPRRGDRHRGGGGTIRRPLRSIIDACARRRARP